GIKGWPREEADPARDAVSMPADATAVRRIDDRLRVAGITPDHQLIVIHVSASNPFRRWPEPAFAEVVASLVSQSPDRRVDLRFPASDRVPLARRLSAS